MKYSSLFTHPSHLPINRAFGEVKSRLNSSPLFTTLHLCLSDNHKGGSRQIQLPGLLVLLEFDKHISLSLLDQRECSLMGEERWRVVKSCGNSSPRQTPCLSGVRVGWVKSEEYFMNPLFIQFSESRIPEGQSCAPISYGRFYYAVWTANWQIWRQLAVLGKTVNCSGYAS